MICIVSYTTRMNKFVGLPSPRVQRKIDYYITPYNSGQGYKRSMNFDEDRSTNNSPIKSKFLFLKLFIEKREDWKVIANFLLNEENEVFRYFIKT
jgi:hypothetical protein